MTQLANKKSGGKLKYINIKFYYTIILYVTYLNTNYTKCIS